MAPPAATVAVLGDDILQEVFILLPTPADLLRAALACQPFLRVARSAAFLRRFRRRHPSTCPVVLGCLLYRPSKRRGASAPYLLPADLLGATRRTIEGGDFALSFLPRRGRPDGPGTPWRILDCRNGSLLLRDGASGELAVADPLTRRWVSLPALPGGRRVGYALVPDDGDSSAFKAVCISRRAGTTELRAFLLSSAELRWADVGTLAQQPNLAGSRAMQAKRSLYWKLMGGGHMVALNTAMILSDPLDQTPQGDVIGVAAGVVFLRSGSCLLSIHLETMKMTRLSLDVNCPSPLIYPYTIGWPPAILNPTEQGA
ncbi:unnamed protein product [Triticum turgidum subsp. durum]|uniref:F-box domain-containing protein n=1 Tax=Triticum turgidum subsp. durum TaxID=4567 RepID=A0A9R0QPS3_TRITD|nr:unnamed protein product [Triticum turgidum subsp. durum]